MLKGGDDMLIYKRLSLIVSLSLVAVLIMSEVQGSEIIFTNYGPGYTMSSGGWYTNWDPALEYDLFGRFSVESGTYTLDSVGVGLVGYMDPVAYDLFVYEDNGNNLGILLESIHVTDQPLGYDANTVVNSATHPLLQEGMTYWIGISTTGTDTVSWYLALNDPAGLNAVFITPVDPNYPWPGWNLLVEGNNFVFEVTGTPVPEPSTMLLLGSGLIGLAGYGRKKFFKK
jgi:hypothetical protein